MAITDWFINLPPKGLTDSGLKMLIYLVVIFTILSALIVFITTKVYKKGKGPSLLDLDLETDMPTPSDIPPAERIAILKIEKAKFEAGQRALSDANRKKEISETIFGRLSVRYASDVKKIEDEIEKTAREVEVSQLEEELKKMQGDYLSKIKGDEKIKTPASTTSVAPPAPKSRKAGKTAAPPSPPTPSTGATPPPPPTVGKTPPATSVPSPPMPTPAPKPPGAAAGPSIPAPSIPAPKPPGAAAAPSGEGDLFAKSTSIAALRKEMLKELDRLKKFMSEQQ
ncbi:MAG: hypothetical protein H7645_05965 [Candidatus Heimdallarchaeota archaeon]|nr:hypothetical protein [Candidatus Heimdallarchaeota archaeon]MCK4769869.1 hypothetical protein [Candidatus Heimdallarchaeota archaeon]